MRMREENYYKVWNNVVNYNDTMDIKAKSHSKWTSNDFFVKRCVGILFSEVCSGQVYSEIIINSKLLFVNALWALCSFSLLSSIGIYKDKDNCSVSLRSKSSDRSLSDALFDQIVYLFVVSPMGTPRLPWLCNFFDVKSCMDQHEHHNLNHPF